jgi:dihydrofolate reductase
MGSVQLYIASSLDGFIADPGGGVGWLEKFGADGEDHGYADFLTEVGAVVMGANTYEQELERANWHHRVPTWVFTHRDLPTPEAADIRFTHAPVDEVVGEIRAVTTRHVFLVGGAKVIAQFLNVGAIDELIMFVVPVILGRGIRLFEEGVAPAQAELMGTKTYRTGLVELRYQL